MLLLLLLLLKKLLLDLLLLGDLRRGCYFRGLAVEKDFGLFEVAAGIWRYNVISFSLRWSGVKIVYEMENSGKKTEM